MTTQVQLEAVRRLKEGLAFHDSFTPLPDDAPVQLIHENDTLYELAYSTPESEYGNCLRLGDLRDILSFFQDQGYI